MPGITKARAGLPPGCRHRAPGASSDEVVACCSLCGRYDPRLNTPFWAYASFWVRKAMQELVAELTRPVALSDRAVRALAHIRSARGEYVRGSRHRTNSRPVERCHGIHAGTAREPAGDRAKARALEEPLGAGTETSGTVGDAIVDPAAEQAYEHVLDRIELCEVRDVAEQLDERERAVIRAHYGLLGNSRQRRSTRSAAASLYRRRAPDRSRRTRWRRCATLALRRLERKADLNPSSEMIQVGVPHPRSDAELAQTALAAAGVPVPGRCRRGTCSRTGSTSRGGARLLVDEADAKDAAEV